MEEKMADKMADWSVDSKEWSLADRRAEHLAALKDLPLDNE
jgi:hypothetical protein